MKSNKLKIVLNFFPYNKQILLLKTRVKGAIKSNQ